MLSDNFNVKTIWNNLSFLLKSVVVSLNKLCETVLSGNEDLLSAWELELGSSEGFLCMLDVGWIASHRHEDLSDVDSCGLAESLTESTSHTLLESIGTSA